VKERIFQTLNDLRLYALKKGYEATFDYHEEDSYLMRFANSAISLNTNEHLVRLEVTAYSGRKRASYGLITDLNKTDELKQAVDTAAEMVQHAQPLNYDPTIPVYTESFSDETGYDAALATISNEEKLQYFNQAVKGLETEEIKLSGVFSNGKNTLAQMNTRSEHMQFFKTSDAQATVVLAHARLKWEVQAEQSAQKKSELDPAFLHQELSILAKHYWSDESMQLPLGSYDIVFGPAATADLVNFMNWIGFNGGLMKRGFSFLEEKQVNQKVFSEKFTLVDDPARMETYPFKRDLMGMPRKRFPIFEGGVFKGFTWFQDDADEFGAQPTGHTVYHKSLVLKGGDRDINTLEGLVEMPRDKDVLYIPFLHYMNIVNPTKAVVTASSRFGALLLRKDGSVAVPYNVRLTQSLLEIFGDKVAWLSRETVPYNTSSSYGGRNPTAMIVPKFVRVDDLEISHSNSSY
jgi:predicted Zn-dependent protease